MLYNFFHSFVTQLLFIVSFVFLGLFTFFQLSSWSHRVFDDGAGYIAFVLDVSQSMNVQDIWDQSRLSHAKEYILQFASDNPWYEYSLTIFAGDAQRLLPFTNDMNLFATFLLWVSSENMFQQGTNISDALLQASDAFWENKSWYIILLTDGDEDSIQIDKNLKKNLDSQKIKSLFVWVWTEQWWYIPTWDFFEPYKTFQGKLVKPKLNSLELWKLAKNIWGDYVQYPAGIRLDSENNSGSSYILTWKKTLIATCILFILCLISLFGKQSIFLRKLYEKK